VSTITIFIPCLVFLRPHNPEGLPSRVEASHALAVPLHQRSGAEGQREHLVREERRVQLATLRISQQPE
jgi:hypothetical protein